MTELYPKGTIVRYTVGPLGVLKDSMARRPVVTEHVKWVGETGIYVGPHMREGWHVVLDQHGDVPVLAKYIEPDPANAEKNDALKAAVSV